MGSSFSCLHGSGAVVDLDIDAGQSKKGLQLEKEVAPATVPSSETDTSSCLEQQLEFPLGVALQPGLPYSPKDSGPPLPGCEKERLEKIEALDILDAPPRPELENILQLVCNIFNTKNALIALFGDKRIYIMDSVGAFQPGDFAWRNSFCGWTMASEQAQIMVVNDSLTDARFKDNLMVKQCGIRFYCGTPLIASNGHRLGTLCFADTAPRIEVGARDCQILMNFAELVTRELEKDILLALHEQKSKAIQPSPYQNMLRKVDCFSSAMLLVDTTKTGWPLVHANSAWAKLAGTSAMDLIGKPLWELFEELDGSAVKEHRVKMVGSYGSGFLVPRVRCKVVARQCDLRFSPVSDEGVQESTITVTVPTFVKDDMPPTETSRPFFFVSVEAYEGTAPRPSSDMDYGHSNTSLSNRRLVCEKLEGLELGAPIAAGSYGRVFRARYHGQLVAVKVLDSNAIAKRDEATGFSLEGLLSERLNHPNIVKTVAWAVVQGEGRMPQRETCIGETLGFSGCRVLVGGVHSNSRGSNSGTTPFPAPAAAAAHRGSSDAGKGAAPAFLARPPSEAHSEAHPECSSSSYSSTEESQPMNLLSYASSRDAVLEGQTWLVMEYCNKGCLQDAVDKGWLRQEYNGPPNLLAVVVTAHEIAAAMQHLHQQGIVHGDLSAFNIMLTTTGPDAVAAGRGFSAKVADFGLARDLGCSSKVETTTYGTITHMAPELLLHGSLSKATDVFSFGVLLWQMYCGSRAWAGMSHAAIIHAVCEEKHQLVFPADSPEGYTSLAYACMDHNPMTRPTFDDVVEILQPLAQMASSGIPDEGMEL